MKRFTLLLAIVVYSISALAQAPQKLSYQAVIRNSSNALVANAAVGMRVSILQGSSTGTEVYKEIYNPNPQTNANGLVGVEIGSGIALTGTFGGINWANGPFYIKTETDPAGGTNYIITGISQLLSVPYALYAATAGTANPQTLAINDHTLTLSNGGGSVTVPKDVLVMNSGNYKTFTGSDDKIVNIQGAITLYEDLNVLENNSLHITGGTINGNGYAVNLGNNVVVSGVVFNSVVIKGGSGTQFVNCRFDGIRNLPSNCSLVGCQITNLNFDNTTNQVYFISNCSISNSTITRVRQITNSTISNTTLGGSPSNLVVTASNNDFSSGCTVYLAGTFTGNDCRDTRILAFCSSADPVNISGNNFTARSMTTNQIQIDVNDSWRYSVIISNNNFLGNSSSPAGEHIKITGSYSGTRCIMRISNNTAIGGTPAASRFISISTTGQIYHLVNDNFCMYTGELGVSTTSYITERNNLQY